MEGRLPVEDNVIVISQLTLDNVSWLKVLVGPVSKICKIDLFVVDPNDVFGSWPFVWSVCHQLLHNSHVFFGHMLWNG